MTRSSSTESPTFRSSKEVLHDGPVPLWVNPIWQERFPWLVQGTTGRGQGEEAFDLGVYGAVPTGALMRRWKALLSSTGMSTAVHARQIHGASIGRWLDPLPPGLFHSDALDGHLTDRTGLLLSISVADCVPVFITSSEECSVALVHSGWRGTAAGIVEAAIGELETRLGQRPERLWLHCGPSICGECYEVGPEVHEGVNPHLPVPDGPTPIDLRAAIGKRAVEAGIRSERITLSEHCTRCGPGGFFSHRAGSPGRQMGVLGCRA